MKHYHALGLDFGSNAARAVFVDLQTGEVLASASAGYTSGENGILTDASNHLAARQHPGDYHEALTEAVKSALVQYRARFSDAPNEVKGIGITATASTPIPVTREMVPLGMTEGFKNNLNAQAWLWKDHSSADEARKITELAAVFRPDYLSKCGGTYSSEWFFSKIFHCLLTDPGTYEAAYSWIELSDYIPALLSGIDNVYRAKRNVCAAGHKGLYNEMWGGLPDVNFLRKLDPRLVPLRDRLYEKAVNVSETAGTLSEDWAERLGLQAGIPIAVGSIDAHVGAIGAGVKEGVLVKVIGTSTCDIMAHPADKPINDIPGVAGIVPDSVLPGYTGIEAGQSAVGDLFFWYNDKVLRKNAESHTALTEQAAALRPGESGLLALDWNNGNRNVLADPRLTGLLIGQTLVTTDFEIYRALIEATAFGARRIIDQLQAHEIEVRSIIACGGIAQKNPLLMQIYADVLKMPIYVAASTETVALGAAIIGGYAALKQEAGFETIEKIQEKICKTKEEPYEPISSNNTAYEKLYTLYKQLHDAFGIQGKAGELYSVMKQLLEIKESAAHC